MFKNVIFFVCWYACSFSKDSYNFRNGLNEFEPEKII